MIQTSKETMEAAPQIGFVPRGEVKVKGKGHSNCSACFFVLFFGLLAYKLRYHTHALPMSRLLLLLLALLCAAQRYRRRIAQAVQRACADCVAGITFQIMDVVVADPRFHPAFDRIAAASIARLDTPKHHAAVAKEAIGVTAKIIHTHLLKVPVVGGRTAALCNRWAHQCVQELEQSSYASDHHCQRDDEYVTLRDGGHQTLQ